MKNIEEGCLALVIGGQTGRHVGKTVTVGKFIGKINGFTGNDRWEIDQALSFVGEITGKHKGNHLHRREANLMRIDGLKENHGISEEILEYQ